MTKIWMHVVSWLLVVLLCLGAPNTSALAVETVSHAPTGVSKIQEVSSTHDSFLKKKKKKKRVGKRPIITAKDDKDKKKKKPRVKVVYRDRIVRVPGPVRYREEIVQKPYPVYIDREVFVEVPVKTERTVYEYLGVGSLTIAALIGLILLSMWLGYILGYKDSDSESARFMSALRDQMLLRDKN